MPARARKTDPTPEPTLTVVAPDPTPDPTDPDATDTNTTDTDSRGRSRTRTYSERLAPDAAGLDGGFETITDPDSVPAVVRNRGRINPFDDPIRESFKNRDEDGLGPWVKGRVANLDAAERQARSAASWLVTAESLDVGVEVRRQPDDENAENGPGVIWFRGKNRQHKTKK